MKTVGSMKMPERRPRGGSHENGAFLFSSSSVSSAQPLRALLADIRPRRYPYRRNWRRRRLRPRLRRRPAFSSCFAGFSRSSVPRRFRRRGPRPGCRFPPRAAALRFVDGQVEVAAAFQIGVGLVDGDGLGGGIVVQGGNLKIGFEDVVFGLVFDLAQTGRLGIQIDRVRGVVESKVEFAVGVGFFRRGDFSYSTNRADRGSVRKSISSSLLGGGARIFLFPRIGHFMRLDGGQFLGTSSRVGLIVRLGGRQFFGAAAVSFFSSETPRSFGLVMLMPLARPALLSEDDGAGKIAERDFVAAVVGERQFEFVAAVGVEVEFEFAAVGFLFGRRQLARLRRQLVRTRRFEFARTGRSISRSRLT